MDVVEKAKQLARYEVGWWKAHHRKDRSGLVEMMAKLYQLQFGLTEQQALQSVELRVLATSEHDIAEELEDKNDPTAEEHWRETEKLLERHFQILVNF